MTRLLLPGVMAWVASVTSDRCRLDPAGPPANRSAHGLQPADRAPEVIVAEGLEFLWKVEIDVPAMALGS